MSRFAVIMAGGSGTRFWPKSKKSFPKQFLTLTGKTSLIQETSKRVEKLVSSKNQVVVTTKSLQSLTRKQLPKAQILCEPEGRNTMAAICWSTWSLHKKNPDGTVIVLPADAYVTQSEQYRECLKLACEMAENRNKIVCLGIKPTFAATGYGYIQAGDSLQSNVARIARFVEKPGPDKAEEFLHDGNYYWNAGIFVFKASIVVDEVRRVNPEFAESMDKITKNPRMLDSIYKKLPKIPFDIGVMEKTHHGAVVFGDFGWSDLGSWAALLDVLGRNHAAGLVQSAGTVLSIDSQNNIVHSKSKKLIALAGVDNLIVVETDDAILVASQKDSQKIKLIVEEIEKTKKLANKFL